MGYRLVLLVAAHYTWSGANLERKGVVPTIEEPLSTDGLLNSEDNQLARAGQRLQEGVAA
jgi:C-terminal processing protease CtpA/Prc